LNYVHRYLIHQLNDHELQVEVYPSIDAKSNSRMRIFAYRSFLPLFEDHLNVFDMFSV
jgi:hypothetical protein